METMKKQVRLRPWVHIYGFAAVWVVWAFFLPMYRLVHFVGLFGASLVVSLILRRICKGKVVEIEVPRPSPAPFTSGNDEVDGLVREGELALSEMARLRADIRDPKIGAKVDEIMEVSGKIVRNVMEDPEHFDGVRRFLRYYLPTTIKLLHAYDRLDAQGISGQHISGTMGRIEDVLDTMADAYKKQLDALFARKALDIETDIEVMEGFLKREGFTESDFNEGGTRQ